VAVIVPLMAPVATVATTRLALSEVRAWVAFVTANELVTLGTEEVDLRPAHLACR
jgi:hypothetical protein